MVFLIKHSYLLVLLILAGCSSTNLRQNSEFIYDYFSIDSIEVNEAIIDLPYASSIFQINSKDEEFAVLASKKNSIETWVTSKDNVFKIYNGKIIKSFGLENDFELINYSPNFGNKSEISTAYIRFKNPDSGILEIQYTTKLVKEGENKKALNGKLYKYKLYEESFYVPSLKWRGENYYWVDENSQIWSSKQILSPFNDKVRITTLKKHSG